MDIFKNTISPLTPTSGGDSPKEMVCRNVSKLVDPDTQKSFLYSTISALNKLLMERGHLLRPKQIESIVKIINDLKDGQLEGLLKLPTGTGKTRLFGEIIAAIGGGALILVPRTSLLTGTKKEFLINEKVLIPGISPETFHLVDTNKDTACAQISKIAQEINENTAPIVIMTYNAFIASYKQDPENMKQILSKIGTVVSDEAHRSIGDSTHNIRTQLVRTEFADIDDEEFDLLFNEVETEEILANNRNRFPHLHLLFTATPRLGNKDVRDYFDHTFNYVIVEEVVKDGTLILPQHITVGRAIAVSNAQKLTKSEITMLSVSDRFLAEDGKTPIREEIALKYLELYEKNNNYLPGVAFCRDIAHAEQITMYLSSLGIRAIRVTSDNSQYDSGNSVEEAEKKLHDNTVDIIVTVSKVGEGWDVPTLRAALWFTPSDSPARNMQGNGRIMRTLGAESHHPVKSRENSYIIEPSSWEVRSRSRQSSMDTDGNKGGGGKVQEYGNTLGKMFNSFDTFLSMGELSESFLLEQGIAFNRDLILLKIDETCECEIDGEIWSTVTNTSVNLSASGQLALKILEQQSEEWNIQNHAGRLGQRGSRIVKLYRKSAVEALLPKHNERYKLDAQGECEVDGEIWTSVTYKSTNFSANGGIALDKINQQSTEWNDVNHTGRLGVNGKWTLRLYRKSAVEALLPKNNERYKLDSQGECEIDGKIWTVVTKRTTSFPVSGESALKILELQTAEWGEINHAGKMGIRGPATLKLYRKSAVEALLPKIERYDLDENRECEIDGDIWTAVTNASTNLIASGQIALKIIEQQTQEWNTLHHAQRWGYNRTRSVKIYRKSAVEALLPKNNDRYKLDSQGECEIDGEIWTSVTEKSSNFPIHGFTLSGLIEEQSGGWYEMNHTGKMGTKGNQTVKIYRKSAINNLCVPHLQRFELDLQGECIIDGEVWTAVIERGTDNFSISAKSALYAIKQQTPEWIELNHAGKMGIRHLLGVKIYRKSAIEAILPSKLDEQGECIIDGEVWTAVTSRSKNLSDRPNLIRQAITEQGPEWHEMNHAGKMGKSGPATVVIYKKLALEKLVPPPLDAQRECIIDGDIWTSVTQKSSNFPLSGRTVLNIVEEQSPEWHNINHVGKIGKIGGHHVQIYKKDAILVAIEEFQKK